MAVTAFQDLPLAERDREWDGDAAEPHVRVCARRDEPNQKYRDARKGDIDRVKSHLAKYYKKMGEKPPWERG
jgi:hypothetical protein